MIGGVCAAYGFAYDTVEKAMYARYGKKKALWEMNQKCLRAGYDSIEKPFIDLVLPTKVPEAGSRMLIDGNSSLAMGAIHA